MRFPIRLVATLLGFTPACAFDQSVIVAWSASGAELDVDRERELLERALCARTDASSCRVLTALHTLGGSPEGAPAFPDLMPRTLVVDDHKGPLDVTQWIDAQRREVHELVPVIALSAAGGPPFDVSRLPIVAASVRFDDDRLEISLPACEILVDNESVGVVEEHVGGSGTPAAVWFADGGVAKLLAALGDGTEVLLSPQTIATDALLQIAGEELRRPAGTAAVGLELDVEVPLTEIVALAR